METVSFFDGVTCRNFLVLLRCAACISSAATRILFEQPSLHRAAVREARENFSEVVEHVLINP